MIRSRYIYKSHVTTKKSIFFIVVVDYICTPDSHKSFLLNKINLARVGVHLHSTAAIKKSKFNKFFGLS